ncbi:UNVERIFIED_CONTAM: hypothetical protein Sradi_3181400 [Sesamum radiatum]|uniref:Uncharacterized protein n=1 Tax=Sesamum radiatum TaxID=300843 RepID=A0AAW2RFG9_SESRA
MAEKFIRKEEMLEMKEDEDTDKGRMLKKQHHTIKLPLGDISKDRWPTHGGNFATYTPLNVTRGRALMAIGRSQTIRWSAPMKEG